MTQAAGQNQQGNSTNREELIRRVAERVWQLWREDLRRDRERRGQKRRS